MNILVTGGAGFIGSHLTEALLSQGHSVWNIDDCSSGRMSNLKEIWTHPRYTFVHGSITDRQILRNAIKKCDMVYHLAAVLGVGNTVRDPLRVIEGCIDGTRNVLELAHEAKIKVVFASTSEIYGKSEQVPFRESGNRVLGATSVHRWCYATAKALDEHMCFAYADKGLPVTILRYFNAYGPRQKGSQYGMVVPKFIAAALAGKPLQVYGDGTQFRCFSYIDDVVDGTLKAADPGTNGLAVNIGSETSITILELAKTIISLTDSSSVVEFKSYDEVYGPGFEDMHARKPDLSRARTLLNFSPQVPLTEGLQKTISWFRKMEW